MLLTEYWLKRVRDSRNKAHADEALTAIYVPPEDFANMIREHNDVRCAHGEKPVGYEDVKEIRILQTPVRRLELILGRSR